jgi:hypothetical protein
MRLIWKKYDSAFDPIVTLLGLGFFLGGRLSLCTSDAVGRSISGRWGISGSSLVVRLNRSDYSRPRIWTLETTIDVGKSPFV